MIYWDYLDIGTCHNRPSPWAATYFIYSCYNYLVRNYIILNLYYYKFMFVCAPSAEVSAVAVSTTGASATISSATSA